jgi:hypothetical protein
VHAFFLAVLGPWNFKRKAAKTHLLNFLTVSDEAFALTVLENFYYDRWIEEGKKKDEGESIAADKLPFAKWTQRTRKNKQVRVIQ